MKWLSYTWSVIWNIIVLIVFVTMFDSVSLGFESIILSMLVFIYSAVRTGFMGQSVMHSHQFNLATIWNMHLSEDIRRSLRIIKDQDYDIENEVFDVKTGETFSDMRKVLDKTAEKISSNNINIYITSFFLILVNLVALNALLKSI